jgi:hypothetical protein
MKDPLARAERDAIIARKAEEAATRPKKKKVQPVRNSPVESATPGSPKPKAKPHKAKATASRKMAKPPQYRRSKPRVLRNVNDIPSADLAKLPLGKTPVGYVPWKLLPPGDSVFAWLHSLDLHARHYEPDGGYDIGRLKAVMSYNPAKCYVGIDKFDGYIVFLFTHTKRIALECPKIGNAIYIIEGDWRTLCRLSKWELLNSRSKHYVIRIIHRGEWRTRLRAALK